MLVNIELSSQEKAWSLKARFPHPARPELEPPNQHLVAAVEAELRRRGGRWAYLPNWVFWPAIRRIAWKGDTFDEAWAWALSRMVKAALSPAADEADHPLGPCLDWGDPPSKGVKREWVPPRPSRSELVAKPGRWARVFTWPTKSGATSAADAIRRGSVAELPSREWVAIPRTMGQRSALWLAYDRRRTDVPVDNDRRKP